MSDAVKVALFALVIMVVGNEIFSLLALNAAVIAIIAKVAKEAKA